MNRYRRKYRPLNLRKRICPVGYLSFRDALEYIILQYFKRKRPYGYRRLEIDPELNSEISLLIPDGRIQAPYPQESIARITKTVVNFYFETKERSKKFNKDITKASQGNSKFESTSFNMAGIANISEEEYAQIFHVKMPENQHVEYLLEERIALNDLVNFLGAVPDNYFSFALTH